MPSQPRSEFLRAILASLLRGRLFLRDGHLPPAGHRVHDGFAGVGVASAADPATDAAVLVALEQLGVRRVRLDFSYGDLDNHVARFLDALIERGFNVWLHLVQPAEAAKRMATQAARTEWEEFVDATLARWGERIDVVEICSTVNRKSWAGYDLDGFLAAWDIGWRTARKYELTIAGPSVTDFEPLWNIGLLALLKKRGQLPDLHSNNLFSERCTEPERWDHKILGHALAPLVRFNLMRKARLLARLSAEAGVPRLASPASFWTLPRIERLLPDSELKQADYLARHAILCAASGALENAFWGPLICHREGLIDDAHTPYPKRERITHYASIEGSISDFRKRPSFAALATFNRLIPGSFYTGRLNTGQDLEMHDFERGGQRIHALWTINAHAAALCDLYSPETIATAQWQDCYGQPLNETPTLVTETPLYALWPEKANITVLPDAAPLRNFALHAHCQNGQHYYHREADWHGVVRAANRTEADTLIAALHPENIGAPPAKADALRHARNAIWTVPDPRAESARLVVKQPVRFHLHKQLLDRLKPSKGRRSWNGAAELERRGLNTATPVAWFESRTPGDLKRNWYVCEYVSGDLSIGKLFSAIARGEQRPEGISTEALYGALADFLVRMHNRGIHFRDLSGGNILVHHDAETLTFTLIDTGRIHAYHRGLPMRKRLSDLVRAFNRLPPNGRRRALRLYLAATGRHPKPWHGWPFKLYDLKVSMKRKIGRKAWRRWLGRDKKPL